MRGGGLIQSQDFGVCVVVSARLEYLNTIIIKTEELITGKKCMQFIEYYRCFRTEMKHVVLHVKRTQKP